MNHKPIGHLEVFPSIHNNVRGLLFHQEYPYSPKIWSNRSWQFHCVFFGRIHMKIHKYYYYPRKLKRHHNQLEQAQNAHQDHNLQNHLIHTIDQLDLDHRYDYFYIQWSVMFVVNLPLLNISYKFKTLSVIWDLIVKNHSKNRLMFSINRFKEIP